MTLALAQVLHLGTARSHEPVLALSRVRANPWALGSVALVLALQFASVFFEPLRLVLHTTPLSAREWLMIVSLPVVPAIIGQTLRTLRAGKPRS